MAQAISSNPTIVITSRVLRSDFLPSIWIFRKKASERSQTSNQMKKPSWSQSTQFGPNEVTVQHAIIEKSGAEVASISWHPMPPARVLFTQLHFLGQLTVSSPEFYPCLSASFATRWEQRVRMFECLLWHNSQSSIKRRRTARLCF